MTDLQSLRPKSKPRVIDLVEETGMDVAGWSDFKGEHTATNPRYAYRWSFLESGKFVIAMLFHEDLAVVEGEIVHEQNIRLRDGRFGGKGAAQWKGRAKELDEYFRIAYQEGLPVRAIMLGGEKRDHLDAEAESSKVKARLLDPEPWAVTRYNMETGECLLVRGAEPTASTEQEDPEIDGFEGELRRLYVLHRRREAVLRNKKILAVLWSSSGEGRLVGIG
jgi:5-methylcytosine-specific restriction enzyme A